MSSSECERAIDDSLKSGNAILKFISPNDAGLTGSHQCGFYMPRRVWEMYTPHPPEHGRLDKHRVIIRWPDGRETQSDITWYGQKTRSEYRLTRFGRDFPYLTQDTVGSLLVLVIQSLDRFNAYVLDTEEDVDEILSALGVEAFERWGVFQNGQAAEQTEGECIEEFFRNAAGDLDDFPPGEWFSTSARHALERCVADFPVLSADDTLIRCCESEYRLFQIAERRLCQNDVNRLFADIDDFIRTAGRIMNRRKSRAGRSLENHIEYLLNRAKIPHEMRPPNVDGKPDIVIPDSKAYNDARYPTDKLFIVGVKTTCKDRWRQVTREGKRVRRKHIVTIQQGITTPQLREMDQDNVTLVVPERLQHYYQPPRGMKILQMDEFIAKVRRSLAQ